MSGDRLTRQDLGRVEPSKSARRATPAAAAIGRVAEARLLILDGEVDRGLALLDEAGTAVTSGDIDPLSTGVVYCELVCALQGLAQYDLAEEWTEAMERWADADAIGSLHGRCRVHRAEILRLRGRCHEAEAEALRACDELRPYLRRELGWPLSELGRIRLHRGDVTGAEQAFLACPPGRMGSPNRDSPRCTRPGRHRRWRQRRSATRSTSSSWVPSKERPPAPTCGGRRCSTSKSKSPSPPTTSTMARAAADELDTVAGRFQSKALAAARRKAEHGCNSPTATPATPQSLFAEAVDSGTRSAHPTKARPRPKRSRGDAYSARGNEQRAKLEDSAASVTLERIRPARRPLPRRHRTDRNGSRAVSTPTMRSGASATPGR